MKRTLFIILAVVGVFLVIATLFTGMATQRSAGYAPSYGMGGGAPEEVAPREVMPAEAPAYDASTGEVLPDAYNSAQQPADRLVIQNADLAIVVKDPTAKMQEVSNLATEFGGFVVSSNFYQSSSSTGQEVPGATIVIRVPAERLDEALERIKEGAVDVDYENRSGQDVTSQYVDLQSRLKAKQEAEATLLKIMDQATRADDVLAIYMQVQSIQTEIEQLKGQIKYYEESAALSSISVQLIAEAGTQPIQIGPWSPQGAAKEAIEDLVLFFRNFVVVLIRFVFFTLPALILIAIPLFLLYLVGRAVYRRVRTTRVVEEVRSEEIKK